MVLEELRPYTSSIVGEEKEGRREGRREKMRELEMIRAFDT